MVSTLALNWRDPCVKFNVKFICNVLWENTIMFKRELRAKDGPGTSCDLQINKFKLPFDSSVNYWNSIL